MTKKKLKEYHPYWQINPVATITDAEGKRWSWWWVDQDEHPYGKLIKQKG